MLRSLNEIMRFQLLGIDKKIGRCKDFLFDDKLWVIRYIVADSKEWLSKDRKVLISTISLREPYWEQYQFPLDLTRSKIENSPLVGEHQKISHQYETELFEYYGYAYYWMNEGLWRTSPSPMPLVETQLSKDNSKIKSEDWHLRSTDEVKKFKIYTTDQQVAHIDDFILNDDNWTISYIVIDTRHWVPGGRKVLISHKCIDAVNWAGCSITVNVNAQKIIENPLFDLERFIDPDYESQLRKYY
ncbi:PRC-barrel domain containing protein [Colwellia hornerae]|uniref:PRC-barrel domain containing protein n=1 Tax=Colwellia hornerae TaxID=89402 RepID=UPI0016813CAC|nr:PRC-barrel domain containing protein [Colwellia hornerae]